MKAITVKQPGVNRADIMNREKPVGYLANPILVVEISDVVEEIGANTGIEVGTSVME